ncbi:MAG: C10 family peptidase, partial [Dysgonamonadaceae bacterium]|nr:C10 family peptidase [Dysgonamonadaceae bacterium]
MNTANKKIYFFPLLFVSIIAFANPVGLQKAKQVGQSFLLTKPSPNRTKQPLKLNWVQPDSAVVDKVRSNNSTANGNLSDATPEFYVFNLDSAGFIIVAGDDSAIPILGYADAGNFDPDNIPPNAQKWLEGYKQEIRYAIENNIVATEEIQAEWEALASGIHQNAPASAQVVAPLIQTKWDQSLYYNQYCPYDNSEGERTVTGCVATAMAQVMKFWNYPTTGTGFHSYNHSKYGTLNA